MLFIRRKACYTVGMNKTELYHVTESDVAKSRQRRSLIAMLAVGGAGLLACVLLCVFTTRRNQGIMLPLIIGTSILMGWIVIFLSHAFYGEARAIVRHDELMLTGERETFTGSFEKTDEVRRVRNGVAVRKVLARVEEHERVLTVSESKAALLPDRFSGSVETVYDFIAAFEVNGDA